jgi:hypothetical protein
MMKARKKWVKDEDMEEIVFLCMHQMMKYHEVLVWFIPIHAERAADGAMKYAFIPCHKNIVVH